MSWDNKRQSKRSKVSVAYHLFRYQEELRSRRARQHNLNKVKYNLINGIVATTWDNIINYSKEEREHLVDSILYKKKLKQQLQKKSSSSKHKKRSGSYNS